MLQDMAPAAAEIFLAVAGMMLLMFGVFRGDKSVRAVSYLAVLSLGVAAALVIAGDDGVRLGFNGLFIADSFAAFAKLLILGASAAAILLSLDFIRREQMDRFEYPVLIVFATLGMMMMVSANDLISLYMGLELQSLALYVLAAFRRDTVRSSEAGLKYFVLGALSSGMLLYGMSMVYGFAGGTGFDQIATAVAADPSIGLLIGLVFMMAGLAFKVSAVPFHMWTPDVYEGAPTAVTAFFAAAPKVAAICLFARVLLEPFGDMTESWRQILIFVSGASMALGALAAMRQTNIKRLMAYSAIGHMGYALVGLAAGGEAGARGVLIYMAIYVFMNVGAFACIIAMRRQDRALEEITDLSGLSKTQPLMAAALAVFMLSMAGIPPLAGFFGKFYVFMAAIDTGVQALIYLAVFGVLASVISAFYYLRIIKIMYFDEAVEPFDRNLGRELGILSGGAALVTLLFVIAPSLLVDPAAAAAASLFAG